MPIIYKWLETPLEKVGKFGINWFWFVMYRRVGLGVNLDTSYVFLTAICNYICNKKSTSSFIKNSHLLFFLSIRMLLMNFGLHSKSTLK